MAGRLTFRPPWWATLLVLAACALFVRAGIWQLDRKAEKEALFADFASGTAAAALPGPIADAEAPALRYRRLRLEGRYDAARQILLDSMVHDGQAGYQVLTPLRTAAGTVLVNRGWLPQGADRERLPDIGVDAGPRQLTGLVDRLPRPGLQLAAASPPATAPWPRRLLFPDAAEIASQLGDPVHDYQVLLDPGAADGFLRDWRPGVSGPDTHLGYAVQWFAFTAAAAALYLALNLKRRDR